MNISGIQDPKSWKRNARALLLVLAFFFAFFFCKWVFSPVHQLERLMKANLPKSATDVQYWYRQVPGYWEAKLFTRFRLPEEGLDELVAELSVEPMLPGEGQKLPTNFNIDRSVTWWNPPDAQNRRYYSSSNGITTILVWHDGIAFIEKSGGFGSMFRLQHEQKQ